MGVLLIATGAIAVIGGILLMVWHRMVAGGIAVVLLGLVLAIMGWVSSTEVGSESNQPMNSAVPTFPIEATPSGL